MTRPLDPSYLVDSGILFEINRTIMHPMGVAMSIKTAEDGTRTVELKDFRAAPEQMFFPESTYRACEKKWASFCSDFAFKQLERRRKHMGRGCQDTPAVNLKNAKKPD